MVLIVSSAIREVKSCLHLYLQKNCSLYILCVCVCVCWGGGGGGGGGGAGVCSGVLFLS